MRIRKTITLTIIGALWALSAQLQAAPANAISTPAKSESNDTTITSINWEYEDIKTDSTGEYYLFNLAERLFLDDDNTLGNSATTRWTVKGNDIISQHGKHISLTSRNEGSLLQPNWVFTASSSSDQSATSLLQSHDSAYYAIGNNVNINLIIRQDRFITADGGALSVTSGKDITEQAQWLFISTEQYEAKTADIDIDAWERTQAIETLGQAIADAEQFQSSLLSAPQASKIALQTAITTAKTMKATLDQGGFLARLISTQRILDTASALTNTIQQMQGISDYYQGALAEIGKAEQISTSTALKAIITAARSGVELSANTSGINTTLNTMHYALVGYMQLVDSLEQETDLTGMITNNSFDRGCLDTWLSIDVDPQKIDITNLSLDNLAALASAIKIGTRAGTRAVANIDADSIANIDGRYYMLSDNDGTLPGQPLAQILLGLPAGSYQLSVNMATNPGLFNTNGCHLAVVTISTETLKEVIGDIDFTNPDLGNLLDSASIIAKLPELAQGSHIITGKANATGINNMVEVTTTFDIEKNDIVLFAMNGGLFPLVGTSAYKADNVQLKYLHAPVHDPEEEDPSAIETIYVSGSVQQNDATYDLSGRPSTRHGKALLIHNGKKYFPTR